MKSQDQIVKFPPEIAGEAVKSAPRTIDIYDRRTVGIVRDVKEELTDLYSSLEHISNTTRPLTALEQLRTLLLGLSQYWQSYCAFQGEPEVPWTNNATEPAIGRMKMRSRTARGYKSWQGMHNGLLIAGKPGD